jgi:hypothetical protein
LVIVPHAAGVNTNVVFCNVNPAGKVSSTCIVVAPGFAAGLVNTNVSVVEPPLLILDTPNAFVNVGAVYTFNVAEAAVPAGAFVLVTDPVLLTFAPTVAPVTTTLYVHVVPTGIVPPASVKLPAAAVSVPVHVTGKAVAVTAPVNPAGYVSVNDTPLSATVFATGFCIVMFIVVVPPTATFVATNDFVTTGAAVTANVAEAAVPVVETGVNPTGALVVLVIDPAVDEVTFTCT